MRLPGTGVGVARLVEVSMVNVDMARASNGPPRPPPVGPFRLRNRRNFRGSSASNGQVRGKDRVDLELELFR